MSRSPCEYQHTLWRYFFLHHVCPTGIFLWNIRVSRGITEEVFPYQNDTDQVPPWRPKIWYFFFSTEKRHRKIGSETRKWANYLDSHIFECMILYDTHTYIHIYIIDSIDTWDNSKTATKQNRDLTKQHNNRSNTHLSTGDVNTSWWNFRLNPMATWPREYPTAHPYFPVRFQWLMVQLLQIPTISPGFIL